MEGGVQSQHWSTLASPKSVILKVGPRAMSGGSLNSLGRPSRLTNAEKLGNACSCLALAINDVILTSILEKATYGAQHCCHCGGRSVLLCRAWSLTREARKRAVVMKKGEKVDVKAPTTFSKSCRSQQAGPGI